MSFVKEFKEFAIRGNVIDLAVGIIIGAAFGKIVNSFVNDIVLPPIGKLLGGVSFVDLLYSLDGKHYDSLAAARQAGAPVVAYGAFIQAVFEFLIITFAVFLLVKGINSIRRKTLAQEVAFTKQESLLTDIRDLLRKKE